MMDKDEQIIAAILNASETLGRRVEPGSYGLPFEDGSFRWSAAPSGACCAIGAGVLFAGLDVRLNPKVDNAILAFAKAYGVTTTYAVGVSDGFEQIGVARGGCGVMTGHDLTDKQRASTSYARGWAVGQAIRSALDPDNDEAAPDSEWEIGCSCGALRPKDCAPSCGGRRDPRG